MKKQLYTLLATTLFLVPVYGYAHTVEPHTPHVSLVSSTVELDSASSTLEESASSTPERSFTVCSQEAIEARDTNIASSRSIYNTAMTNALTERKNREKAAVALKKEDAKKEALKVSVETYKAQAKAAQTTLTQARKVAWQEFDEAIQACRDIDTATNKETTVRTFDATPEPATLMRKSADGEEVEQKTIKDTIKAQFESFKSLFN